MSVYTVNNKWRQGNVHLELPSLSSPFIAAPGIKPISVVLDSGIGDEIILLIIEPKNKAKEFEGRNITKLMLKTGLVNTSFGPVCFLLFYFPDPLTGAQVTYENTINPKDHQQLSVYDQLSNQRYWHVVIADDSGEVVNFFEFPNEYGLSYTLEQISNTCTNMQVTDFMSAKAEYENKYSIDQLLAL